MSQLLFKISVLFSVILSANADDLLIPGGSTFSLAGSSFIIDGEIKIQKGAKLEGADGILVVGGAWKNNGSFTPAKSTVIFNGARAQVVSAAVDAVNNFNDLTIDNLQGIELAANVKFQGVLEFSRGHLTLNAHQLILTDSARIKNYSAEQFVVTNGAGSITREKLGSEDFLFPVGISKQDYSPILVANEGVIDDYSLKVARSISHGLLVAGEALQIEWRLIKTVVGGSYLTLTRLWKAGVQALSFSNSTNFQLGAWGGDSYDLFVASESTQKDELFYAQFNGVLVVDSLALGNADAINRSPPVLNPIANQNLREDDSAITVPLIATDIDNDEISFSVSVGVSNQPSPLATLFVDGANLRITPKANATGQLTVTIIATAAGESDSQQFVLAISPVNDSPTVELVADQTAQENIVFSFSAGKNLVTDIDSANLTVKAQLTDGSPLPSWLVFSESDVSFLGVPPKGSAGVLNLSITASDGEKSAASSFSLIVVPANDVALSELALVNQVLDSLSFQRISGLNNLATDIQKNLDLPSTLGFGETITWQSSNPDLISSQGDVMPLLSDVTVVLVAKTSLASTTREKTYFLTVTGNSTTNEELLANNLNSLSFSVIRGENVSADSVRSKLVLLKLLNGLVVDWRSEPADIINADTGSFTAVDVSTQVKLVASQSLGSSSASKTITITLKPNPVSDAELIAADAELLTGETIRLNNRNLGQVVTDLRLPKVGPQGSTISWETDTDLLPAPVVTSTDGEAAVSLGTVTRLANEATLSLVATLSLNDVMVQRTFLVTILASNTTTTAGLSNPQNLNLESVEQSTNSDGDTQLETHFVQEDGSSVKNTSVIDESLAVSRIQTVEGFESTITVPRPIDVNGAIPYVRSIVNFVNINGTVENIIFVNDVNGSEFVVTNTTLDPQTTTEVSADGEILTIKDTGSGRLVAKVSGTGEVEHKVSVNGVTTKASSQVKNSAVQIGFDGSVQTTARIIADDMRAIKIEVLGRANGFAEHKVSIGEVSTQAEFQVVGTQTVIDSSGKVTSSLSLGGSDINVISNAQGLARHSVTAGGVTTTAEVRLAGAKITVTAQGLVETSMSLDQASSDGEATKKLKATVSTDAAGKSGTGFAQTDSATGSTSSRITTLANGQLFPAGSKVVIVKVGETLQLQIETPIDGTMTF